MPSVKLSFIGKVVGITSAAFMAETFVQESIFGRSQTFFEPNRYIAAFELAFVLFGIFAIATSKWNLSIPLPAISRPALFYYGVFPAFIQAVSVFSYIAYGFWWAAFYLNGSMLAGIAYNRITLRRMTKPLHQLTVQERLSLGLPVRLSQLPVHKTLSSTRAKGKVVVK